VTAVLFTGLTAAANPVNPAQQTDTNPRFDGFSGIKAGGLPAETPLLSSISAADQQYNPGDDVQLSLEVDANQRISYSDAEWVTAVYKCGDASCENPPQSDVNGDGVVDKCTLNGDVEQGKDDCIALLKNDLESNGYQAFVNGQTASTQLSYSLRDGAEPGRYAAEGYLWDTVNEDFASDHPGTQFTVQSRDNDDDEDPDSPNGEPEGTTGQGPDIRMIGGPKVDVVDGNVRTEVTLKNYDGTQPENWMIEMQVRPKGQDVLSFVSPVERTCSQEHPENVNKEYRLSEGDQETITLTSNGLPDTEGQQYSVYLLTREACAPNNQPVEPFTGVRHVADVSTDGPETITTPSSGLLLPVSAGFIALGVLTGLYWVIRKQ
jgi:hypothetical protein